MNATAYVPPGQGATVQEIADELPRVARNVCPRDASMNVLHLALERGGDARTNLRLLTPIRPLTTVDLERIAEAVAVAVPR